MTIKTKKTIRCVFSILLDLVVIGAISFALYKTVWLFNQPIIAYFVAITLVSALACVVANENIGKLFCLGLIVFLPFVGVGAVIFVWLEKLYLLIFIKRNPVKFGKGSIALNELEKKSPQYSKVARYVDYRTNFPVVEAQNAKLYFEVDEYLNEIIKQIDNAKSYILLEFYIVEQGLKFSRLQTALFSALKRGIEVSLTVDYFGSGNFSDTESAKALKMRGAKIITYKPPLMFLGLNFNTRTHRKIAVIDGEVGFLGGINFRNEDELPSKDSGLKIMGKAVKQLERMIYRLEGGSLQSKSAELEISKESANSCNNSLIQPFSVSGKSIMQNVYFQLLVSAKREVIICSPYFSFNEEMRNNFRRLIECGVRIKLMLPKKVCYATNLINCAFAEECTRIGVEVYFYTPKFLHEKLIVIDGAVALIGSPNFDLRSQEYQIESGALIYDKRLIDELVLNFSISLSKCEKVGDGTYKFGFATKIYQKMLKVFSYFA